MKAADGRTGGRAVGIVVALLTAGPPVRLTAQSQGSVLIDLPGSTRAAGLRGAGAALVGDAGAVFSNPAGIATIRRLSIEGAYQRSAGGTTVGSGALALRAGRLSWGFGVAALDTSGVADRKQARSRYGAKATS